MLFRSHKRRVIAQLSDYARTHVYNMTDLADRWKAVYGDNLIVRPYDRSKLVNGDITDDFFASAFDAAPPLPKTIADRNLSIAGNLFFLKRLLNNFTTDEENVKVREDFTRLADLDETFNGSIGVPAPLVAEIYARQKDDLEQLKSRYEIDFGTPPTGAIDGKAQRIRKSLSEDFERILEVSQREDLVLGRLMKRHFRPFKPFLEAKRARMSPAE